MLTVSTVPLVLCTAPVVLTLLISGIAKAKGPAEHRDRHQESRPAEDRATRAVSLILPWFEIALAAVLLLSPGALPAVIASGLALDPDAVLYGGDCARAGDGSYCGL